VSASRSERGTGSVPPTPRALAGSRCGRPVRPSGLLPPGCEPVNEPRIASTATRHRRFHPPPPPHAVRTSVAGGAARLCEQAAGDGEPHPLPRVSFRPAEGGRAVCAGGGVRPQTGGERMGTREVAVFRWLARAVRARPLPRHRQRSCARSGRVGWGDPGGAAGRRGAGRGVLTGACAGEGRRLWGSVRPRPPGRTAAPASPQMSSAGQQNTSASMQKASASRAETSASMQNLSASMQNTSASMQNLSASMQNTSASMQNTFASTQMSPYAAPENADVPRTRREVAANSVERAAKSRERSGLFEGRAQAVWRAGEVGFR
jgi:hypothetical protein